MNLIYILIKNKVRIFIRNRWTKWFSDKWHLINLERTIMRERIEYKFCLIGFELVISVDKI